MLCIEIVVVGQAGLVFLQFLLGVLIENTCSAAMKKATSKSKRRFKQAFSMVKLKSGGKAFNMNKLKQQIAIDEQKAEVESKRQRELEIEKELKIVNVKEIDDDLAAVLNDLDDDIVESKNDNSGINRRRRGKLKKQATTVML